MSHPFLFSLFFLFSLSSNSFANPDSLWAVWNNENAPPTERLAALQALNDLYHYEDPDAGWQVIELQNEYASKQNDQFWIAKSLDNQAEWYSIDGQVDSAIVYSYKAIALFEQIRAREELGTSYLRMGYDEYMRQDLSAAFEWMKRALAFGMEYEQYRIAANSLNALGTMNFAHGNIVEGLDYLLQEARLLEKVTFDQTDVNDPFGDIAMIYHDLNELDSALMYVEKAIAYNETYQADDLTYNSINFGYKGQILEKRGQLTEARKAYNEMLRLGVDTVYEENFLYPLSVFTGFLFNQNDEQAKVYIDSLIQLAEQYDYASYMAEGYALKGSFLQKENRYLEGLRLCESALNLIREDSPTEERQRIYDCLYHSHKVLQNYEQALFFYEKNQQIKEEMLSEANIRKLTKLEMNAIAERDKATAQLTYQTELQRQRFIQYGLIGGLGLLGLLAFVSYHNYRNKAKANQLITAQKQELEQLNITKDRLFAIIGHDLRKPSLAFRGIGKKVDYLLQKKDYTTLSQLTNNLEKAAFSLNSLLDNLLNWALQQRDVLPYQPQPIHVKEVTAEIEHYFQEVAAVKGIHLSFRIDEQAKIFADPNAFTTIVRNLVDNAIKFTPQQGKIEVSNSIQADKVILKVEDTGIGIAQEELHSLFKVTGKKSKKGTHGESGTGLGLSLVQELVKLNKGAISVKSQLQQGTIFKVSLPAA
jgi:signal transduction histidine kinase